MSELYGELNLSDFLQGGSILPLAAPTPSEAQQLSMRVFALWLSLAYMTFVQVLLHVSVSSP